MLIATTDTLQGYRVEAYLGLATGHAILGMGVTKQFRTGIRDVGSGSALDYGQELDKVREEAIGQARRRAEELGANALIGLQIGIGLSGDASRMLLVSVSGTAVLIAEDGAEHPKLRRADAEARAASEPPLLELRRG